MAVAAREVINLPRVANHFEDSKAGREVDKALAVLSQQLVNFKAADAAAVGGAPAASVAAGASGIFYQTFETPVSTWLERTSSGTVTYPTNGQAGGKALRSTGGETWVEFPENIAFDPDRLYRVRVRVRMVTAPTVATKDLVYAGFQAVAADGSTIVDINGSATGTNPHWICMDGDDMGALTLGDWYVYTGYVKGTAATGDNTRTTAVLTPSNMHEDTRYVRPTLRLNAVGGDGVMEIDYFTIEVLTESPEIEEVGGRDVDTIATTVTASGDVGTDKVVSNSVKVGAVNQFKINTPDLGAISSALGTIVTGTLQAAVIVASQSFTATVATFNGVTITDQCDIEDLLIISGSGAIQVEDGRILELYDSGNTFRGDIRGSLSDSAVLARGNWRFGTSSSDKWAVGGATPQTTQASVTGSRGGNAALANLLTVLASYGLITDSTT